ncbi:MAG: hypothetical protein ABMA64_08495 [Myxococcota bacterium]
MWVWISATTAWADCAFRADTSDLARVLSAAEAAYVTLDPSEFERAMTELDYVVPCLDEPVSPADAAHLHRLRGIGRFVEGDAEGALAALAAARTLEPAYVFPAEVFPPEYELRRLYEALPAEAGETARLPRARGGQLLLDGVVSQRRPVERPVVFQWVDEQGAVRGTSYLGPDLPVPSYPGVRRQRTALLLTGALTAGLAAASYGVAWSAAGSLVPPEPGWDDADLRSVQRRANTFTGVSLGLSIAAAGQVGFALFGEAK